MNTIIPLSSFKVKKEVIRGEILVYNIHLKVLLAYKNNVNILITKEN